MRKRKTTPKLKREKAVRQALIKSQTSSLITKGEIKTTKAKAKALRTNIERMITDLKKGDLASQRRVVSKIDKKAASKLIKKIAPKYKERTGGYTRLIKVGRRSHDNSEMVIIQLV